VESAAAAAMESTATTAVMLRLGRRRQQYRARKRQGRDHRLHVSLRIIGCIKMVPPS
jgi:hypothetical protein